MNYITELFGRDFNNEKMVFTVFTISYVLKEELKLNNLESLESLNTVLKFYPFSTDIKRLLKDADYCIDDINLNRINSILAIVSLEELKKYIFFDYPQMRFCTQITATPLNRFAMTILGIENRYTSFYLDFDNIQFFSDEEIFLEYIYIKMIYEGVKVGKWVNLHTYLADNKDFVYEEDAIERYIPGATSVIGKKYVPIELDINNKKETMEVSIRCYSILQLFSKLNDSQRAVIIMKNDVLHNESDSTIRKYFLENNYVETVIKLPGKISSKKVISDTIFVVRKEQKLNDAVKFIDISECVILGGQKEYLDFKKAIKLFLSVEEKKSFFVSKQDLLDNNYSLNFDTYKYNAKVKNGVALKEIAIDIYRGYQIKAKEMDEMITDVETESTYKILQAGNIDYNGEINPELTIINAGNKNLDRYLLHEGDIVISARGDKIKKTIIKLNKGEKIIPNGSLNVIRIMPEKVIPLYLKMFLESKKGQMALDRIKCSVSIPAINIEPLKKLIIPIIPLSEQLNLIDRYNEHMKSLKDIKRILRSTEQEIKVLINDIF